MFKFGARAHDYGKMPADVLFAKLAADGFTGTHLALNKAVERISSIHDVTGETVQALQTALAANAMEVAVFGSYVELSMVDEVQRQEAVNNFKLALPIAKKLCAKCVGSETTNNGLKQPHVTQKEAFASLLKSLYEIMPLAEELGIDVAVEPVFYHTMATPELTKEVIKTIASPRLKVIFDPVNLLSPQEIDTQESLWARSMDCFADEIAAVHMKGVTLCDGKMTSAPFAESVARYERIFDELKKLDREMYVLREEIVPAHAAKDLAFLKQLSK